MKPTDTKARARLRHPGGEPVEPSSSDIELLRDPFPTIEVDLGDEFAPDPKFPIPASSKAGFAADPCPTLEADVVSEVRRQGVDEALLRRSESDDAGETERMNRAELAVLRSEVEEGDTEQPLLEQAFRPSDSNASLLPVVSDLDDEASLPPSVTAPQGPPAGVLSAPRRSRVWLKVAIVGACLVIVVLVGVLLTVTRDDRDSEPHDTGETSARETSDSPQHIATAPSMAPDVVEVAPPSQPEPQPEPSFEERLERALALAAGPWKKRDEAAARAALRELCQDESLEGCLALAGMLAAGRGGPRQREEATALLAKACGDGADEACWRLAALLAADHSQERAAAGFATRACHHDVLDGCAQLGRFHRTGFGVSKDPKRAVQLFDKACQGGSDAGCRELAASLYQGRGTRRDRGRAAELADKACQAGDASACFLLGTWSRKGRGVPRDKLKAALSFQRACELNHPRGCERGCSAFASGSGVEKDLDVARALCDAGCALHSDTACFRSGELLREAGLEADARERYHKACRAGNRRACRRIE